jgi:putative two-component system response regulator
LRLLRLLVDEKLSAGLPWPALRLGGFLGNDTEGGADYEQAVGDVVTGPWANSLRWASTRRGPDFQGERLVLGCGTFERRDFTVRLPPASAGGVELAVELSTSCPGVMNFPHDPRMAVSGEGQTTIPREAASDQDMHVLATGRHAPRILVVDDHATIAGLMSQLLSQRGYEVVTAADAEQAAAEVRRQAPDLILSDVKMPGKSGYELCRELKADPATRLIPFVLITGLSDSVDKVRGIEAGADDFLNKPVLAEELTARVKSLLRVKEFTDELETADSVLCTLGLAVESRDPYTEGHCERLAARAADLGRHLGLDTDSIVALRRGGYLHDLGKIAVPDAILKKGTDLTLQEWEIMKVHPVTGENICKPLKSLRLVLPIIRHHHEHADGSGYPDGLRSGEIPLLSRVLQVVDVYDALRTARPYKLALGHDEAAQTMREEARQGLWDAELVNEFFSMLVEKRSVA